MATMKVDHEEDSDGDLVSRQAATAGCSLALEAQCGVAPPCHSDE